ncbi:helix-turn-helix transcriptional regulator [uncultured Fibrobacter sp.]|uniref:helix-turn-helix domain-containing protein n=1 Tax=uncultured Fibrobacter sp. TaxID=261512 RepID=UPI0026220AAE|nr:helix-turn-helix transcriptional regulator [uncultured Fibrobacter sp.]
MEYKDHILHEALRRIFLDCRRRQGLTQNGLSCLSNITRQFISQVEGGKRQLSINSLSTLANVYHKSLSDIFKEVDRLYPLIETGNFVINTDPVLAAENNKKALAYLHNIKRKPAH